MRGAHFDGPCIFLRLRNSLGVEQGLGGVIRRKVHPAAAQAIVARAAIPGNGVQAAILMTMVMVQGEASTFVVDDPCAGMIIAHVKRDTDFVIGAFTDMHDNAFSAPGIIFLVFADEDN